LEIIIRGNLPFHRCDRIVANASVCHQLNDLVNEILQLIDTSSNGMNINIRKIIFSFRSVIPTKRFESFKSRTLSLWSEQRSAASASSISQVQSPPTVKILGQENIKMEESSQDEEFSSPEMVIQRLPPSHKSSSSLPVHRNMSLNQTSAIGNDSQPAAYLPSKRASAMLDAAKENKSSQTSEITKKSKLDVLFARVKAKEVTTCTSSNTAQRMNFFDDLDSSQLLLPDTNTSRRTIVSSKLHCVICQEKATNPCAGRCGHVCCAECWSIWMATKSVCPVCREPMTKDSISKLIIKA
jgi:hypothetical protein